MPPTARIWSMGTAGPHFAPSSNATTWCATSARPAPAGTVTAATIASALQ